MAAERSEADARRLSRSTASRDARQVAFFRHARRAPQPHASWRRRRAGKCELRLPAGGVTRAPRPLVARLADATAPRATSSALEPHAIPPKALALALALGMAARPVAHA